MKKFILTLFFITCLVSNSYAGFNFGSDTYEKVDDILIVNSLGDQTTESIFKHDGKNLGFNDFIPENAFKNDLYNQGYSVVYDYDDVSLDLVEVGYMGVRGDPRSYDADYVLRKEYEKYSSQSQDIRIDKNKNEITNVDKKHTIWNDKQDARLDGIDVVNAYQDMRLDANKNNILINRDNINANKTAINNVDTKHTDWNNAQDNKINNNQNNITNNTNAISHINNRVDNIDNRVKELEQTQTIVGGAVRIIDSKKWNVELFADYSTNRNMIDRTGIRFTLKFGTSWQEKEFDKLNKKIQMLEERL